MENLTNYLVQKQIYNAVYNGCINKLRTILDQMPAEEARQVLNTPFRMGKTMYTPLMVAARSGFNRITNLLITEYHADVEVEGVVDYDNYLIAGATPLWCACSFDFLDVVKTLVEIGHADVNHVTKTLSTPVRAACFNGNLEICKFLVESGADYTIPNQYDSTCLMIASYNGHLDVVEYLLSLPIDCNLQAKCGSTALHFAAENGQGDVVKRLLSHGVKILKNHAGMTPLISAAERTKASIVEYFISTDFISRQAKIDALELLGASFANDKAVYSLERCLYYLRWSMEERFRSNLSPLPKMETFESIRAYGHELEFRTIEELDEMENQPNRLHMQGLLIRQRILGLRNEIILPIVYRGAVFADDAMFEPCLELWIYALELNATKLENSCISDDLLRFTQIFCQMINLGFEFKVEYLQKVLQLAYENMKRTNQLLKVFKLRQEKAKQLNLKDNQRQVNNYTLNNDLCIMDRLQNELDENMIYTLYLLVLCSKVIPRLNDAEKHRLYEIVYNLNRLRLCTRTGASFLHLCLSSHTPVRDVYNRSVCKFPCAATTELLIRSGADVNQPDLKGNTPLHIAITYEKPISDFRTIHSIIEQLIKAGAHSDYTNNQLQTPKDLIVIDFSHTILKSQIKLRLTCLAARAVNKHNLSFQGQVPVHLYEFILKHRTRN